MKPIHLHAPHLPRVTRPRLPRVTRPRWGWRLFVVAVAVLGCLPAVIVRFQILATLDEFDANRVRVPQPVREAYADAAQRSREEEGRSRRFDVGVLR